ncbi:alcohol dehydrogenase catalytic domain-containing protein [Streptomyces sp. NPDC017936]|uniref:alcohol dehydrogenase catalytic domain-containing protein n=1 Tax=Streptomyces sp. NPDC017936 TaxID=3365016 RepID=UPI0037A2D22D
MTRAGTGPLPRAVVFDLFGTLVDAPAPEDRRTASRTLARLTGAGTDTVERILLDSWSERHDGRLPTLRALADHLWQACGAPPPAPSPVRSALLRLAAARLVPAPGVRAVLEEFRALGVRVGLLSDASADIAEAWPAGPLAPLVDVAVFSCRAGALKPEPGLYREVLERLGVPARSAVYCGDGGGDELRGAAEAGLTAVRVARRGGPATLSFGAVPWAGPFLGSVEDLPGFLGVPKGARPVRTGADGGPPAASPGAVGAAGAPAGGTMTAWEADGGALRRVRVPRPVPKDGEVVVDVGFSGLCGSDLAKLGRSPVAAPPWAWRPGHEIVGRRTGSGAGDWVVVDPLLPCGRCAVCAAGDIHLCPALRRLGWDVPGGFAEQVVAPRANVLPLPAGVDPAAGVLADGLAVAVHGVRCGLRGRPPAALAVVGSGPLALGTAAWAAAHGWSVTVVARDPERVADVTGRLDAALVTADRAPEGGFDAVVDAASGHDDAPLRTALRLVRDGGAVVVQNAYAPGVRLGHDLRDLFRRSVTLVGSFSYCRRHGEGDLPEALAFLARHPGWTKPLVHHRFPLRSLPEAVAATAGARDPRPIKAVLTAEEV